MKRILVIRTDRIGDVLMMTPVLRELKKTFPGSFIAALTQPHTANLLTNNPNVDKIITDDLKKESFWNVVKEIRKNRFTHGLLLMPMERAAYQLFLGGVKTRIGVGRKLYEIITGMKSVSRNNFIPLRHEADYCMDLARKIGVESNNIQPEMFLTDEEKREAKKFLSSYGISDPDKKIIIHTGSFGSAPNWSEEKYLELIRELLKEIPDVKIILTAREMSEKFKDQIKQLDKGNVKDLSVELDDLRKLSAVISVIDILIAPSTGPLHIADALQKKAIGLYCNRPMSSSKKWGVINKHSVNIEISTEYCDKFCSKDKNTCAFENGISVSQVIDAVKK